MKILVINAGSSSLKYQLIDMDTEKMMAKGICDRIGTEESFIKYQKAGESAKKTPRAIPNHVQAFRLVTQALVDPKKGVISDLSEISAVGHRVVQGGAIFDHSVLVTDEVIRQIQSLIPLAPLHNKPEADAILACREVFGKKMPQCVVFDTSFHATMPEKAYLYAIPYEYYEKYKIRRYGFHGTSHRYVSGKAIELLGKKAEDTRIVTCHLGNGSSISAVKGGKIIDTSMGFTPLEGVIMGSRCGAVDPAIIPFLMEKEGIPVSEMGSWMNKKCGFLGVSGVSSDMREITAAIGKGNDRARLAYDILCYQIKKYIGSYTAAMGGLDCIVFTAGIGENTPRLREDSLSDMEFFGIKVDKAKNNEKNPCLISADDSRVKVFVIPTNEELVIACDTDEIVSSL